VMKSIIKHAEEGKLVLGICNGFQVLTEAGLLPGALIRNRDLHFICDQIPIKIEHNNSIWTKNYQSQEIVCFPIAHGEGNYFAQEDTLKELEDNGQILFRYCDENARVTDESCPNGSAMNIAGICNKERNVFGMMPHPERAADAILGNTDGRVIFESILQLVGQV